MDSDEKLESCFDGRKSTSMVGASVDFYNMRKDERITRMQRLMRISMACGGIWWRGTLTTIMITTFSVSLPINVQVPPCVSWSWCICGIWCETWAISQEGCTYYTASLQLQVPITFDLLFMLCLLSFATCCGVEFVGKLIVLFIWVSPIRSSNMLVCSVPDETKGCWLHVHHQRPCNTPSLVLPSCNYHGRVSHWHRGHPAIHLDPTTPPCAYNYLCREH